MVCLLHVHVADPILNPFQLPDVTFCSAHRASSRPGSLAWPLASVFLTVFKHRNKQNTCCLYLLYVTSLSVRYRRHTSARQARPEKRPRHPARRHWMRPTRLARCRAGCPHAPLRSHRDRHSFAHRPWAPRARTFTTFRTGAGAPPSAELQHVSLIDPSRRAVGLSGNAYSII